MNALIRYLGFAAVAGVLIYGGYRLLTPATTNTASTEKVEREEEGSNSVVLSDAKVEAAGIELAKASPGVLRDSLLLNGMVQPNQEIIAASHSPVSGHRSGRPQTDRRPRAEGRYSSDR